MGLVSEQCLYNLSDRMVEMEVLPAAEAYGMGVIPGAAGRWDAGRRAEEGHQGPPR